MESYFFLLSVPAVFAVFVRRRVTILSLALVSVLFVFFVGMRYRVGTDWSNYQNIHEYIAGEELRNLLLDSEPASYLLFWLSMYVNNDMLVSNMVAAVILVVGVFAFARRTANPWLAIVSATPYLIIAFGMTGIRQAMGIGLILFLLSVWDRCGVIARTAFVILASLFHTSALIAGVLVIFQLKYKLVYKLVALAIATLFAYFFVFRLFTYQENIEFYQDAYLSGEDSIFSPGALFHVALVWIPAIIYLALRQRMQPLIYDVRLMDFGSVSTILLLALYFLSSTVASRLTLYLYFVPMLFYPAFVCLYGERNRVALTTLVIVIHFGVLAAWMLYANNSHSHIPYRNIVFEDRY